MENWCWLAMSLLMEQSEPKLNSFWVSFFRSKVVYYLTFHFWKDHLRWEARSGSWFEVRNAWWYCKRFCWNMQSRYFLDIPHSGQPKLVFFTSILSPLVSFVLKMTSVWHWYYGFQYWSSGIVKFKQQSLKYLNFGPIEHDQLVILLNKMEDFHESYANEFFVREKNGISEDHYIRSLKGRFCDFAHIRWVVIFYICNM